MSQYSTNRIQSSSFTTIQTPAGSSPVANGPHDTLTLTSSDNSISITGNATTDTIDLKALGGGGGTYTGASPATITVGGISAGYVLTAKTFTQILQDMLVVYQNPYFSSFLMSGQATSLEVGYATVSGTQSFTFGFGNASNVTANTLAIIDVTTSTTLASGLPITSPESANIGGPFTLTAPGSHSWKGQATNTNSVVFSSDNFTVNWFYRNHYGTSTNATLAASDILALVGNPLASGFAQTQSFAAGGYKYYCWPDTFGSPTASTGFKDTSNGLPVAMATVTDNAAYSNVQNGWYYALVSVTNTAPTPVTTSYRVYRTQNVLGGTITIQVS